MLFGFLLSRKSGLCLKGGRTAFFSFAFLRVKSATSVFHCACIWKWLIEYRFFASIIHYNEIRKSESITICLGWWLNGRALALQARGSEIETLRFHVDVFYYSTWYTLSLVYRYTKPTKRFFRCSSLNLITATNFSKSRFVKQKFLENFGGKNFFGKTFLSLIFGKKNFSKSHFFWENLSKFF